MDQEYIQRLNKIETELKHYLPQEPDLIWAEKVFGKTGRNINTETIKVLIEPLKEIFFRGGKRWRPLLMTLICETLGGGDAAIKLSPVVEFSHNASLIHDDIEDNSDERRGKPAIHKLFGIDIAINSGSFFYFLASSCIESFLPNTDVSAADADSHLNKEKIYKLWTDCMRKLHLGQSMDITWHRNIPFVPSTEEYFLMCTLKTGSLARLSAELGAHIADATPEVVGKLGDAADKMGIGFQILDDVKNLTTGIHGKKRGDDVVEGKKSFPVILFLNKYPEKRELIFKCFHAARINGIKTPEIEELINVLSSSSVFDETEEKGKSLLREAKDIFHSLESTAGCKVNKNSQLLLNDFINLIG
jgi:octaprenyl-diphosphate synthase